jgi:hypothetical protein
MDPIPLRPRTTASVGRLSPRFETEHSSPATAPPCEPKIMEKAVRIFKINTLFNVFLFEENTPTCLMLALLRNSRSIICFSLPKKKKNYGKSVKLCFAANAFQISGIFHWHTDSKN